jgi:hypothetical protein
MRETLQKRLDEWSNLEQAQSAELRQELGTLRALARHALEQPEKQFDHEAYLKVLDRLIRAADVQQRVMRRGMVSLETVHKYIEAVGLVVAKHVKDPDVLARIEADAVGIPLVPDRTGAI